MSWRLFPHVASISAALMTAAAWAEEPPVAPAPATPPAASAPAAAGAGDPAGDPEGSAEAPPPPQKGKRVRGERAQKDATEGTEALGRFEADTVLKSKYQLDGQPLEVDPD